MADGLLTIVITIIGTNVLSTIVNWFTQRHFLQKVEKYMEKRKNGRLNS